MACVIASTCPPLPITADTNLVMLGIKFYQSIFKNETEKELYYIHSIFRYRICNVWHV